MEFAADVRMDAADNEQGKSKDATATVHYKLAVVLRETDQEVPAMANNIACS